MTISAYNLYKIGDTFHNRNGEDYIILNMSKERDKALLAKRLDEKETRIVDSPVLFIGAKGLNIKDWMHGHYSMEHFDKAVEWFMTDDEVEPEKEKGPTVEDILKLYKEEGDKNEYTFWVHNNDIHFKSVTEIPDYLRKAELEYFSVTGDYNGIDDMEFPHGHIYFVLAEDTKIITE